MYILSMYTQASDPYMNHHFTQMSPYTVECRFNAVQYCKVLHKGVTQAEYLSDAGSTKDTPYFALAGELWGVFSEFILEN